MSCPLKIGVANKKQLQRKKTHGVEKGRM